ncbi:MAG: NAD(P)-dependent oxidoreductase [Chloroflexota bacterium]
MSAEVSADELVIGVVGLGKMGQPIAERLLAAGAQVAVYDVNNEATAKLVQAGATSAETPAELASECQYICTVVPDGTDVEAAFAAPDGVLAGMHDGLLCLEMSTIPPEVTRRVAGWVCDRGGRLVDAAIGRGIPFAADGRLLFMVGGSLDDVARARAVLDILGDTVRHCGDVGAGVTMKLVNNLLGGVTLAATCEALLLGRKAGLSLQTMIEVLSGTAAATPHLSMAVPNRMAPRNFEPGFRLDLARKDADLAISLGRKLGVPVIIAAVAQELRVAAIGRGLGSKDSSAIVCLLEDLAGTTIG